MARRRPSDRVLSGFGKMFEAWRSRLSMSQRVVADMIGTQQRTLSGWLTIEGMPDAVHHIARLAAFMGTTVEELIGEDAGTEPFRDPEQVRAMLLESASPETIKKFLAEAESRASEGAAADDSGSGRVELQARRADNAGGG